MTPPAVHAPALPRQPAPRVAPAPSRRSRRLEVVRTAPERRLRARWVAPIACLLLFGALFGLVAFQTVLIQAQARIDQVDRQVKVEEARHRELSITAADLRSPERVIEAAKDRLGMVEPGVVTFLRSSPDDDDRSAAP